MSLGICSRYTSAEAKGAKVVAQALTTYQRSIFTQVNIGT